MSLIDIVIVNYNTRDLLRDCLNSIDREMASTIIVIDNASTDGSAEMVNVEFPTVSLIKNTSNLGYGGAANLGISNGNEKYILLLNSDVLLPTGTIAVLCDFLANHPKTAILGPLLVHPDGRIQHSCFSFPTLLDVLFDISNISHLIGYIPFLRDRYTRTWKEGQSRQVPWVLGAAMAIRREAFEQVGGFDEAFYMFYEEVDLSYRLMQKGWHTHFTNLASIIHVGSASTQQKWTEMTLQLYISLAQFYRRHYSYIRLFFLVILIDIAALLRFIRDNFLLRLMSKDKDKIALKNQIDAWKGLLTSKWYSDRSHTQTLHKIEKQISYDE